MGKFTARSTSVFLIGAILLLHVVPIYSSSDYSPPPVPQTVWYVSVAGSNLTGNGLIDQPFGTIQYAMDKAVADNTVVVMEGRYRGPGNTNLDFRGKALTVRSQYPEDDSCIRATIIDAQGKGVIARFVNDEGPNTVFTGFTLVSGDTNVPVHGVPGFFEFSDDARPTTSGIRIAGEDSSTTSSDEPLVQDALTLEPPWGGRLWNGNDPFNQPAATTDYFGSGDADNDGVLTPADVALAQQMVAGLVVPSARADANGNGTIDDDDVSLIYSALSDGTLSGWWNSLASRAERDAWIDTLLTVDPTDEHPYWYWYQCLTFSTQLFIRSTYYRGDLAGTFFDGGQTVFNVPMYMVGIGNSSYGHAINAILVGDNPLDFADWRFVEPQTDEDVQPGGWNMPYNTTLQIYVPELIEAGGTWSRILIEFFVDTSGGTLVGHNANLLLIRPTPTVHPVDNRPDLYNPKIVPGTSQVLFERTRDDMERVTDIHLSDLLPTSSWAAASPVVLSSQYSRLLDVAQGPDGAVHLLWKGKSDYVPGVFHGLLDPTTNSLTGVTRVSTGSRNVAMGRVIVMPSGELHAFWLEGHCNSSHPYSAGVYWTRWTGSSWQEAQNLTPQIDQNLPSSVPLWDRPDPLQYTFDTVILGTNRIVLVWVEWLISGYFSGGAKQRLYNGTWEDPVTVDAGNIFGVDLEGNSDDTLHLITWSVGAYPRVRGNLEHRIYDGISWSLGVIVDNSDSASSPRLTAKPDDGVVMVWDREVSGQILPVWSEYVGGQWQPASLVSLNPDTDAWYPSADVLADGGIVMVWSARTVDNVTFGVKRIAPTLNCDFDGDGIVDIDDMVIISSFWNQVAGAPYDQDGDGTVTIVDIQRVARWWGAWVP